MNKLRRYQPLLPLALMIIVTVLFMKSSSIDFPQHQQNVQRFRELKQLDAFLNEDILKSRFGLLKTYDPLVTTLLRIHTLYQELAHGSLPLAGREPTDIKQHVTRLGELLDEKASNVEEFKSRNAVLTNAMLYFPAATELMENKKAIWKNRRESKTVLDALLRDVLIYNLAGEKERRDDIQAQLHQLVNELAVSRSTLDVELAKFLLRVNIILLEKDAVDAVIAKLVTTPVAGRIDQLRRAYEQRYQASLDTASAYRLYLYLFSLLLLVSIVHFIVRLRFSAGALAQANEELRREILERKQGEEERSRLAAVVEQAAEAVIICDTKGDIRYVNSACEQVTGYTRQEVMGKTPRIFNSGKQDEAFYRNLWATVSRGEVWRARCTNKKKDGTLHEIHATISPVFDAAGAIVGYVQLQRDITQEIELEAQLQQAQKMEAIGMLAGGVAHDFNNLLTGILGYASLLKWDAKPGDQTLEAAEIIEKSARKAAELIKQLLGFAREGKFQHIQVNLHDTIQEVVNLLRRTIDKNIRLTQELRAEPAVILGDPVQMQQVVLNLAVNARDAMPDGGELQLRTELVDLDEESCRLHSEIEPGCYVMVSVTDSGCGIPKEIQRRIFEPFFTTKEIGQGTGMGLAMVYGIVKNHGGMVRVVSEEGCGATFKLYVPLATVSETDVAEQAGQLNAPTRGTGRILLVDDEEIVRTTAMRMLRALGYDVVGVSDGQEAVEYYARFGHQIDLVIVDMIMPTMGGRDCFRRLQNIDPEVRAVVCTGYSLNEAAQELLDEGMLGFIQKPFQLPQLSKTVVAAMSPA